MAAPSNGSRRYEVHISAALADAFRTLHRRASRQGRGPLDSKVFRRIVRRLELDPLNAGEPAYRLPKLRMQVRTVIARPLVVDFGVCEDRPHVYIKGVKLLSAS
ncbi:MAG TPA: hypothetical protein VKS79_17350 [Gemmataceae bacterium]|nr:hypothetical protein [Gemmataceae bacterium]